MVGRRPEVAVRQEWGGRDVRITGTKPPGDYMVGIKKLDTSEGAEIGENCAKETLNLWLGPHLRNVTLLIIT